MSGLVCRDTKVCVSTAKISPEAYAEPSKPAHAPMTMFEKAFIYAEKVWLGFRQSHTYLPLVLTAPVFIRRFADLIAAEK